jgi:glycosyltransferase involved in cell wall biosynthesis
VISFIIPAHNEEALIGRTLSAMHESAKALGESYEIIVVDDSSTDRTGVIAGQHDCRVVTVTHRQISATRNAGARVTRGEFLIFVDADTQVTMRAVRGALRALRSGAVGGGCCVRFDDGNVPLYAAVLERLLPLFMQALGMAAGCFLFCTRHAYLRAGGFDEAMYWGEEVAFGRRLKRFGRFVILREFVVTSARKLRTRTLRELVLVGIRLSRGGQEGLEYWYGRREM